MILPFSQWLEARDFNQNKDTILSFLNLDHEHGLGADLDALGRDHVLSKLKSLGLFAELPEDVQMEIESAITNNTAKTVGDIVRMMNY